MNFVSDFEKDNSYLNKVLNITFYSEEQLSENDYQSQDSYNRNDCMQLRPSELFLFMKESYLIRNNSLNLKVNNSNKEIISLFEENKKIKNYFNINKDLSIPDAFLEQQINNKIKRMNTSKEMKLKLLLDDNNSNHKIAKIKVELDSLSKKRSKGIKFDFKVAQPGRKKKEDNTYRHHNKYSSDNVINKIKNMINKSLLLFINKLIKVIYHKKENNCKQFSSLNLQKNKSNKTITIEIKKIQYDFRANKTKRDDNLEFLNHTLKKYLSNKISSKYDKNNYPPNFNEMVIDNFLNDENNKDIFDFVFNYLTIGDWLEIFIYKKELKDFNKYNLLNENQKIIIKGNLVRIDNFLDEIYQEDKIYFHIFCLLIYNLKRYLTIKESRIRKKKEEEN